MSVLKHAGIESRQAEWFVLLQETMILFTYQAQPEPIEARIDSQ